MGKAVVFKTKEISGPRPFACAKPQYKVTDYTPDMGCEEGQGYFFGRPMPAAAFETQFLTAELEAVSAA